MRIAIGNGPGSLTGGVEVYLRRLIPELLKQGHEVVLGYELSPLPDEQKYWPGVIPSFDLSQGGPKGLDGFVGWGADLYFCHMMQQSGVWDRALASGPCLYFAHGYLVTCVSGRKYHRFPRIEVCQKQLGWPCLLHYLPRGCGGRNPLTMLRQFRHRSGLLNRVRKCRLVVTHSEHMQKEMSRHVGVEKVRQIHFCLPGLDSGGPIAERSGDTRKTILFLGRMVSAKGGDFLIRAIPFIDPEVRKSLRIVFAGDGSMKDNWSQLAAQVQERFPMVSIEFPGWLDAEAKTRAFREASLFAMPNVWPEPLGMAPLEAMSMGVPVVGFARGGFSEYVQNGFNGFLAPEPISPEGLAESINSCLLNPDVQRQLGLQAKEIGLKFSMSSHVSELKELFNEVLG